MNQKFYHWNFWLRWKASFSPCTKHSFHGTRMQYFTAITFINPYLTNGFSHRYHLGEFTFVFRGLRCDFKFLSHFFDEFSLSKQNSPRWDAPRSAASHLGLYCLPMSHKKDARLKWVKGTIIQNFECMQVIHGRWIDGIISMVPSRKHVRVMNTPLNPTFI